MTAAKVLRDIVEGRRQRIARDGHDMGSPVPARRDAAHPVAGTAGFSAEPFVICEIKRRSPSRGAISEDLDPVAQARRYAEAGVGSISVLTEQDRFGGSLDDLMAVKHAYPHLAVLRKDFLIDEEDVEVSYRAGADAVLLIAAILRPEKLAAMYRRATSLGLAALVEVHNRAELEAVRESGVRPEIMGINARDLNTFRVDLLAPLELRKEIDWPCKVVFESGIFAPAQVALAASGGFTGVLVGEAAVREPALAGRLAQGLLAPDSFPAGGADFWGRVLEARGNRGSSAARSSGGGPQAGRPLVKICGIAREEDGRLAAELGADIIGFVFAESPRRASLALLKQLRDLALLKIAVVTAVPSPELIQAREEGLIDAFQYHGDESPLECLERGQPFYKALRIRDAGDTRSIMDYPVPRVLIDAWSPTAAGGTGRRLDAESVRRAAGEKPLWLAGGLDPDNVAGVIRDFAPELVDASSGLESVPGRKDPQLMRRYFEEIERAGIQ
jgi:indole-3-glycerol phosphate synthase/phosphoribosylanthranilate isomerase